MGKGTESRRRGGGKPPKPTSVLNAVWQRKKLGKYNLLAILGKGAMGGVFRAEDDLLKRQVALKVLPQRIGDQGGNAWGVEQFIREARSAAQIEHPNVTRIYEIGEESGYYYIAMELVEGGDLESKVKKEGPLDPDLACKLISQCASGLHFAHNMGVVHRDVKPANVMLTKDGQAKLTDFGLARIDDPDDEFSLPTEMVGTPKYVAPEVCLGQAATALSDVYSLGATMWFVLTGEAPFNEKDPRRVMAMQVKAPLPDLTEIRADLPNSLVTAVYRSLAKKAEERFKNCEEMAEVLSNHEGQNDELSSLASAIDDAVTGFTPVANASMTSRSGAKRSGAGGKPIRQPREVTRKKQNNNAIIIGIVVGVVLLLVVGGGLAALFTGGPSKPDTPNPPQDNPRPPIVNNPGQTDNSGGGSTVQNPPSDQRPDPRNPDETDTPQGTGTDWANAKPVRSFGANSTGLFNIRNNGRIYQVNGAIDGMTEIGGNYRMQVYIRGRGIRVEYDASNSELVSAVNAKLGVTGTGLPKAADGEEVEVTGYVNDVSGLLIVTLESPHQIKRRNSADPDAVARTPADTDLKYVPVQGREGNKGVYGKNHFIPDFYFRSDDTRLKTIAKANLGLGMVAVVGKVAFAGKHPEHQSPIIALQGQDPTDSEALLVHFGDAAKTKKMLDRFGVDNLEELMGRTLQINGRLTYKDNRMIYDKSSNDERKFYWAISEPGQTFFLGSLAKQFFAPGEMGVQHDELKRLATRGDNVSYGVTGRVTKVQSVNGHYRVYLTSSTTDSDFFISIGRDSGLQGAIIDALKRITKDSNANMESLNGQMVSATGKLVRQGDKSILIVSHMGQFAIDGRNIVFEYMLKVLRGEPIKASESVKLDRAKTMQLLVDLAADSKRSAHLSGSRWLVRLDNDVVIAVANAAVDDVVKKLGLHSKNAAYGQFTVRGHVSTGNRYGKYTIFVDGAHQVSRTGASNTLPDTNNNTPGDNKGIQNSKDWLTVKPDKRYKSTETQINNDAGVNPDLIFAVYGQLEAQQNYKYTLGNIELQLTKQVVEELQKRLSTDKLSLHQRSIEVLGNMKAYDQGSRTLTISAVEQIVNIDGVDGFRTGQAKLPEKEGGDGDPAPAKPEFDIPNGFEKLDFTVDNLRLDLFRKLTNQTRDNFAAIGEVTAIERMGRNGWVITLKEADPGLFRVTVPTSVMSRILRMTDLDKETDLIGKSIMALGRLDNKMRLEGKAVPRIIVRKDADLKLSE